MWEETSFDEQSLLTQDRGTLGDHTFISKSTNTDFESRSFRRLLGGRNPRIELERTSAICNGSTETPNSESLGRYCISRDR